MTAPETARRPSRRSLLVGGAALALVVLVVVLVATLGGRDDGDGGGTAAATTAPTTTTPAPATSAPPPTPTPTGPTGDVTALPATLDPVGLADPAEVGTVTARLTDVAVVDVTAQGPGSVSGRSLQVTVELTNGSASSLPLDGVEVTADTGEDRAPAPRVEDGETEGLGGTVDAGATATGTYLFSLPDGVDDVTVQVGYQAGAPLMVFTGQV
jgi:hypothetical protein